ncbi:MAG TPA: nickel pincer cofactor biosynthesis protein LarC [Candidatus Eisenbacteria bacterium]|nr:nickel pincer cofactor biosynthesis protein LarC [Candidatus Eisenbacteria bacterium]
MRIAWFDTFSGISGDMCLGALVGAGWPAAEVEALPARLALEGVRVRVGAARRGPFAAVRVEVAVDEARQPHRHLRHVEQMIDVAEASESVRTRAREVFRRLAEAEAEVHGATVETVHFHEVGAADAIVDVLGTLIGLEALGVERVWAAPPRLGRGRVDSQHGQIPVPAPATTLLLRGAPVEIGDTPFELVTPTGAALLATLVRDWGAAPAMRLEAVGTGAGARDLASHANVLRVLVGEALAAGAPRGRVVVLETAIDDENPQFVATLPQRLLAAGALDAMIAPVTMKKGRPGFWLVVVAPPERQQALAELLLTATTTLGVRVRAEERYELPRRTLEVPTAFGAIALKVAQLPDGGERAVPEFESVRSAAERTGRSLREISEAALDAWRSGAAAGPAAPAR